MKGELISSGEAWCNGMDVPVLRTDARKAAILKVNVYESGFSELASLGYYVL